MSPGRALERGGPPPAFVLLIAIAWQIGGCASTQATPSTVAGSSGAEGSAATEHALASAELEAARGRPGEAEVHYREALAQWPDDPRVLAGLTRVLIDQGELEEAVALDDRVARGAEAPVRALAPRERCSLWLDAARARLEAGRGDALEMLGRIDSEPACPNAGAARLRARVFDDRARAAAEADDLGAAVEGWRIAAAADPDRVDLASHLGRALLDAGRRREAVGELSDALARHPDSPELEALMLEALGLPVGKTHAP